MLSPFLGLSLLMHLLICFMYEMAIFLRGLFFGFKKYTNKRTMILVRNHDERFLPIMIIGMVVTIVGGIASLSVEASYQNKPNTFDLISSAIDTPQMYQAPNTKESPAPKGRAPETGKMMIAEKPL